jgi:arginyl-tRNA synthetase
MLTQLTQEAHSVLERLHGLGNTDLHWEAPKEAEHGDVSTAVALRLSKQLGRNPREIAQGIADELSQSVLIDKCEVAGPGYVNIWLKPAVLVAGLEETESECAPKKKRSTEAPVIVEYSQPNIAKPLGIHHILSTVIGQSVSNLYEHNGHNVIRWNYMGDWGTQFGKLSVAMEKWGSGKKAADYTIDELLALYVRFHTEAEAHPELEDEARAAFLALEKGDKKLHAFWEDVITVTKASLASLYARLNVAFDLDLSESFYEDKMNPVIAEGKKKGVFTEGEGGSLIVQFPEDTDMPPYLILKGDGATLYSTRDIAQMRYRIDTYHPQAILIFTDIAQKLHFEQLEATCRMLGWELPRFENVLFGRMRFADSSMSTRKGNILKLEEVLDEAVKRAADIITERGDAIQTDDPKDLAEMMGVGALVYGILSQNRKMDIVFDWDKMLSFDGNSAPYLQYTHARARSVLRKAESKGEMPKKVSADLTPNERALILMLLRYSAVIEETLNEHLPHKLANYLFDLCQHFNTFYNTDSILQADEPARSLRLFLTRVTADVLRSGATLLTIRVPDRM